LKPEEIISRIFTIALPEEFETLVMEIFRFQYQQNPVYKIFAGTLNRTPERVHSLQEIPFLPVEFFREHKVYAGIGEPELEFVSSGTTGPGNSRHYVASAELYRQSFMRTFSLFYGDPSAYCILALLPSYFERSGSSLVYMMDHLIRASNNQHSGFYLHNHRELANCLSDLEHKGTRSLLLGVTFALLDFAEEFPMPLPHTIVMETGGMKGRRKEIIREEVHKTLCSGFSIRSVHSEYGMTELLSQAYSVGGGRFRTPPWMQVFTRDPYDPFKRMKPEQTGAINVIDLANIYSCSFLATGDIGKVYNDGSFEVIGRMDQAEIRGCSLMSV